MSEWKKSPGSDHLIWGGMCCGHTTSDTLGDPHHIHNVSTVYRFDYLPKASIKLIMSDLVPDTESQVQTRECILK